MNSSLIISIPIKSQTDLPNLGFYGHFIHKRIKYNPCLFEITCYKCNSSLQELSDIITDRIEVYTKESAAKDTLVAQLQQKISGLQHLISSYGVELSKLKQYNGELSRKFLKRKQIVQEKVSADGSS